MSVTSVLAGGRAYAVAMPSREKMQLGITCLGMLAALLFCYIATGALATKHHSEGPAAVGPYMTFVDGNGAEPPPWPQPVGKTFQE